MDRMGNGMSHAVSSGINQAGNSLPINISCQETPSESSETDTSECDTTGDEDGWESGELIFST